MIYLDNAATTHKKPFKTYWAIFKGITTYNANPSRGSHNLSIKAGLKVEECRERIKNFVNAPESANVVYTYNCTEAINFALQGSLNKNSHVVITTFEHNAVLRTLHALKAKKVTYSVVTPNKQGNITLKEIKENLKDNTKMIVINHTSNVTGKTTELKEIGNFCRQNHILFMVDCAQSAGHNKIDMINNNINFVSLAGHKGLFGTQGIGALVINNTEPKPLKFGGSGTNSESKNMPEYYPDKLEAGTINTLGILALDGGIQFVQKNIEKINKKTNKLTQILLNYLKQNNNYIVYSQNDCCGVVSFNHKQIETQEIVNYLNENKICVRGGLHCAPLAHNYLKTLNTGTVRVSISYFNTIKEIKKLIKVLNKLDEVKTKNLHN